MLYVVSVDSCDYIFKFRVWAKNNNEAKKIVLDVYNNEYNDELPENRKKIDIDKIKIEGRYSEDTKSHVLFVDYCSSKNNTFNKVDSFVDNMMKIIEDFEKE